MATTNPGPAITSTPEPQLAVGNIQKNGVLTVTLTPVATAAAITAAQTFTAVGLGLVVGDQISTISPPSFAPAGVFPVGATVTAADTLSVNFANVTAGSLTAPAGVYTFEVNRIQPNFSQNAGYMNSF